MRILTTSENEGVHRLESACCPIPEGKEPTHARCGHLPHHTLRHRRRFLPLPTTKKATRSRCLPLRKRGHYPCHLRPLLPILASERDFYRYASGHLRDA